MWVTSLQPNHNGAHKALTRQHRLLFPGTAITAQMSQGRREPALTTKVCLSIVMIEVVGVEQGRTRITVVSEWVIVIFCQGICTLRTKTMNSTKIHSLELLSDRDIGGLITVFVFSIRNLGQPAEQQRRKYFFNSPTS